MGRAGIEPATLGLKVLGSCYFSATSFGVLAGRLGLVLAVCGHSSLPAV
jgi:hypothetical protein